MYLFAYIFKFFYIILKKDRGLDFNHLFLSYTIEGAEKAMREQQRAKSGKKKKSAKNKTER